MEFIGTENNGVYRMDITDDILDLSVFNENIYLYDKYYNGLYFPIKCNADLIDTYDSLFYYILEQCCENCADIQFPNLSLFIQDDLIKNKRLYYLSAMIKLNTWDENAYTYKQVEINFSNKEKVDLIIALFNNNILLVEAS